MEESESLFGDAEYLGMVDPIECRTYFSNESVPGECSLLFYCV